MYVQKIFEDCKRELGIRRSIEVLQGYRIQIPMTAGMLKPCVFLPVEDMEEEQLKTCITMNSHIIRSTIYSGII